MPMCRSCSIPPSGLRTSRRYEATEWWAEQGTGELIVAFPAEDEAEVRRILENL